MSRPSSFFKLPDGGENSVQHPKFERRTHEQLLDLRRRQSPSRLLASPRDPPPWELRDDRSQLEKDFLDMETNAEIDQELRNLKAKLGGGTPKP